MLDAFRIFVGGMAAILLFAGGVWLLGLVNDRRNAKAKAEEAANPGQASEQATRLVFWIGKSLLTVVRAIAWLVGLVVLPAFAMIVYQGVWEFLPLVVALTFGSFFIERWAFRILNALGSHPNNFSSY